MSFFTTEKASPIDQKQSRLMQLAALFMLLYSVILTLAPAVRLHTWDAPYRWNHWIGFVVWLVGCAVTYHQLVRWLPERDPYLFPIGALLAGWGLLTIWRLDTVMGIRQTIWLAVCLAAVCGGLRVTDLLGFLRRYKYLWLTGGLLLTGLTFLFGTYPGGIGPRLWLGCCGLYFMPSEPLKLLLIAYLAAYLADRLPVSFSLMGLLTPTLIMIGGSLILLVAQRDLGTASLFILLYTIIIYIASNRKRMLVISLLVLIIAGVTGYLLFDVVRIRVDAWLDPWIDPAGRSYQIVQSLIAVASGGFLGRGPGLGSPGVVPVSHSDFVFASVSEETGLLGAVGMLGLFALLVGRGFRTALFATNNYRRYLAAGVTTYLVLQGIFIIGGNLRLAPLTGVTLPFVSYGGSSLLTAFVSLLTLMLISSPGEAETAPLPNPFPYLLISGALLVGLLTTALIAGWWTTVRADMLTSRPENPRRVITERYVPRGALLDRSNKPIDRTVGGPGDFHRQYEYPALSDTTGYNDPLYGQAGLEAGLDGYLRGLSGTPGSLIFVDELLYGQTPPGLDVRLTIDLNLQKQADTLLTGHKGALVLLNARSGEILAIASHPNFDPSQLEQNWSKLLQDPNAPLLNRATQGQYPPGAALAPFLYAFGEAKSKLPATPQTLTYTLDGQTLTCALTPQPPVNLEKLFANGCPAPLATLGQTLGLYNLNKLFASLGFDQAPALPLEMPPLTTQPLTKPDLAAIGQDQMTVTPLQMALAAAALSNIGQRPAPELASAVLTPQQGWQLLPHASAQATLLAGSTEKALAALTVTNTLYWQTVALARTNQGNITWYLGGTLPQAQGTPLALALVLEEPNAQLVQQIGQSMLNSTSK